MINKLKNNKGITLIALVITIIVLLILAGVAIRMLAGDNGILRQAADAKEKTNQASVEEQIKIVESASRIDGHGNIDENTLEIELNKTFGEGKYEKIPTDSGWQIKVGDYSFEIKGKGKDLPIVTDPPIEVVKEKVKYKDENSKNTITKTAVIPKGFKVSDNPDEQHIDTGLVVIAPDESEFVWVPVDDINTMIMCKDHSGESQCNIIISEGKLACSNHGKAICGKLYITTSNDNLQKDLTDQTYVKDAYMREPDVLTQKDYGDASTVNGRGISLLKSIVGLDEANGDIMEQWENQHVEEFETMALSVYKNKGFYVGRYEMSFDSEKNAQSVRNTEPIQASSYSFKGTWYGLYQKIKEYSEKETIKGSVKSSMIWGSQYDQMMLWMIKSEYDVNSTDSSLLKGASRNTKDYLTGYEGDPDVINNVYDLIGCNIESTMTARTSMDRQFRRWKINYY